MVVRSVDIESREDVFGSGGSYYVRAEAVAEAKIGGELARLQIEAPCDAEAARRIAEACSTRESFDLLTALLSTVRL